MIATYWNKMTQYKFSLCYLQLHFSRSVRINRIINISTTIAASAAIAAWAAWQNLAFFWGLVIVLSQVISSINQFLPYQKRIEEISGLLSQLSGLYICVESDWYNVANGKLTEEEINNLCYEYVRKWDSIDNKFFQSDTLPQKNKLIQTAEEKKNEYFINCFDGGNYGK